MLYISKWKATAILLTAFIVCLFAVPNFFPESTVKRWPAWAQRHIVLGLDLQGGSHILLEVDANDVRRQKLLSVQDDVRKVLREARVGLTGAPVIRGNSVEVRIREIRPAAGPGEARELSQPLGGFLGSTGAALDRRRERRRRAGPADRDRAGDHRAHPAGHRAIGRDHRAGASMRWVWSSRRSSARATTACSFRFRGWAIRKSSSRSSARPPSSTFRLVDTSMPVEQALQGRPPPESEIVYGSEAENKQPYLLEKRIIVSGEELTDAQPGFDQRTSEPIVSFKFNTSGARKFAQVTQENVGRPFAIVLDDEVISAPVIREPILGGSGQISGNFTVESANNLAILLRAGALPAKLTVIEQRVVGAGLGQDSIEKGKLASYFGAALVVVFMVVTYGLFGVFATIAVAINVGMIFGILSLLNATLTLPGIIGIVLTIGIAVDSNVLIYERIREEVRTGRTPDHRHRCRLHPRARDHSGLQHHHLHRGCGAVLHRHRAGARLCGDARHRHRDHRLHRLHPDAPDRGLVGAVVAAAAAGDFIGGIERAPASLHPAAAHRPGRHQVRFHALSAHQLSDLGRCCRSSRSCCSFSTG